MTSCAESAARQPRRGPLGTALPVLPGTAALRGLKNLVPVSCGAPDGLLPRGTFV